jgi:hypothetical protein
MGSHKETAKKAVFPNVNSPPSAEGAGDHASHSPPGGVAGGATFAAGSSSISATVVPAHKVTDPKVQLVEVEPGIYDIYFTCSCCEQYVIRCESLEKAATASPSPS